MSCAERGRGKFQATAGPELGARKRRNEPDWTAKGLGGEGRGLGCTAPERAGLTPGRRELPVPTAGANCLSTAGGLQLPSFLDFHQLFSASQMCQPRRQPLEVSVAVFLHFSWFVSVSAVSLLPLSPWA